MFGSYNKFHHKVHITASVISSLDFLTSIISGVAIFSILGNLAKQQGVAVSEVVNGGPGLAFITLPQALAQLPLPQVSTGQAPQSSRLFVLALGCHVLLHALPARTGL